MDSMADLLTEYTQLAEDLKAKLHRLRQSCDVSDQRRKIGIVEGMYLDTLMTIRDIRKYLAR